MEFITYLSIVFFGIAVLAVIRERELRKRSERGYKPYLWSVRWKIVSKASKHRDGNSCRGCGRKPPAVRLESHHPDYSRLYHERPKDLTTLCPDCHLAITISKKLVRQGVSVADALRPEHDWVVPKSSQPSPSSPN